MKKRKNKVLVLALAVAVLFSTFTWNAFATDGGTAKDIHGSDIPHSDTNPAIYGSSTAGNMLIGKAGDSSNASGSENINGISKDALQAALADTAQIVLKTAEQAAVGDIGSDWAIIGLARMGYTASPKTYEKYYAAVEKYVKSCDGVLHDKKYTEYSRIILAVTAMGKDAGNVAGYDLTKALGDYDKTIWQGINGPVWALIALDSADYPMPENADAKTKATRQMYIDRILECQLADGGWSLTGGTDKTDADSVVFADPDVTGMTLQALAKYKDQPKVKVAVEKALACVSKMQGENGGFKSYNKENLESNAQIIVALCELGIPLDDSRFIKGGNTLLGSFMKYYEKGKGFRHTQEDGANVDKMATEQALYTLVAIDRAQSGKNGLYDMQDAKNLMSGNTAGNQESTGDADGKQGAIGGNGNGNGAANVGAAEGNTAENSASAESVTGLPGKNAAVKIMPVIYKGKTFADISATSSDGTAHKNKVAIETLAERGIIDGIKDNTFAPDENMTRAQFAAIVVRALGLSQRTNDKFKDVPAAKWYAPYIGTASDFEIINGVGGGNFNPEGLITRQEAAVMVARAAKLCGIGTIENDNEIKDMLAQFGDYTKAAAWAQPSLALCYKEGILNQSDLEIQPQAAIKRCEIAQMLCNMLSKAELITY